MSTRYITESVICGHHVSKDYFMPFISRILAAVFKYISLNLHLMAIKFAATTLTFFTVMDSSVLWYLCIFICHQGNAQWNIL